MTNIWTDNPAGLYTNVAVLTPIDIGTNDNRLDTIYAETVVADNLIGDTTLAFNNYLNAVSSTGGTLDLLKGDTTDNTVINTPTGKVGKLAVNGTTVGTWDSNSIDFPAFNLTDGSDKNYALTVYAVGTAYTLTAVAAALDFGTTDPSITLNKAGTYFITSRANLEYNGATFAANRTATLKLRRTNNTPADLTNGSTSIGTNIVTTVSGVLAVVNLPGVLYTTTNTDDAITIFGSVSVVPTAGSLDATEASIVAVRLY